MKDRAKKYFENKYPDTAPPIPNVMYEDCAEFAQSEVDRSCKEQRENIMKELKVKEALKKEALTLRSNKIELLEEYSMWLTKHGYTDTDWKDEEPFAIDEFLAQQTKP